MSSSGKSPVGFNLLAWSAPISEEMHPIAERLKTIGYDGIECFIDYQDVAAYQKYGAHLQQLGLQSTSVMVVSPDENPASDSATIREQALTRFERRY